MSTFNMTTEWTPITCASNDCGVLFAITSGYRERRQSDHRDFYCPNGHVLIYRGDSDAAKARKAEARARHLEDQLQASQEETESARRELVRQRSRFANGVCPECNRSFTAIRRNLPSVADGITVEVIDTGGDR